MVLLDANKEGGSQLSKSTAVLGVYSCACSK